VTQKTFDLFVSSDNLKYTLIGRDKWKYIKDDKGVITITLKERLATRYLKIHVWYDNRDAQFVTKDKATFLNELGKMLQVYQEASSRTEVYEYDVAGNRTLTKVTLVQTELNNSLYYPNSDRLKTDGKYLFSYDNAGNLVKKEKVNLVEDEPAEIWDYTYDLLNRLVEVKKNGTLVSEYGYDPEGLRVVKRAHGETIHYVFEGTEPIYEKNVTTGKIHSYVYVLGKHFARIDGNLDNSISKKYFYQTDNLGSTVAVTDVQGKTVWSGDYTPFGKMASQDGILENVMQFTGKEFDKDIGLYYFNARWMDSELGRFISEDPLAQDPNFYSYCGNNPLNRVDPCGMEWYNNWNDFKSMVSGWFNGGSNNNNTNTNNGGSSSTSTPAPTTPTVIAPTVDNATAEKVKSVYDQFKNQNPDVTNITPEKVAEFAKAQGLNDAERLYLSLMIAHDNPDFVAGFKGSPPLKDLQGLDAQHPTWCNAYAAYSLYLFSGDKELMNSKADASTMGNFRDPTKGWTLTVSDEMKVIKDPKNGWKEVTAQEAQNYANNGKYVVGIEPTHVAVVSPGEGTTNKLGAFTPAVGQEGRSNLLYGVTDKGTMANAWMADDYKNVKFYVKL
jgi:RHS repeat-associated protein